MEAINLGIDLGRSQTRLYDGERLLSFPSLVGGDVATVRHGSAQLLEEHLEQNLTLKLGENGYSVGSYALEQSLLFPLNDVDFFQDELNLVLMLAVLGLYMRRQGLTGTPRFKLCLGMPVFSTKRPGYVEKHLRDWTKLHRFEFCGRQVSLEIVQIDPIPQPMGAIYAAILAGQLDYSPEENVGVIDPGHLTTDWILVRLPNELTRYSGQTTRANGERLYDSISEYLTEQGVQVLDPLALMESVHTGAYRDAVGDSIPVPSGLIDEQVAAMAKLIALTVRQSWRDIRVDRMLLVGGFGQLLYPRLQEYPYFKDLQLAKEPRVYNVKGYYEYAVATPLAQGLSQSVASQATSDQRHELEV